MIFFTGMVVIIVIFASAYFFFFSIHKRDSNILSGTGVKFLPTHSLYNATQEFKNLPREIWKINSQATKLQAKYYPQKIATNKTIILVHGFGVDHNSLNIFGQLFYRLWFNVLMPDNRAAGKSNGKYIGFGYLEKYDLCNWIVELNNRVKDQKILLFGASMGAATILQASGMNLPNNVLALIEDSSYTQADEIIMYHAKKKVNKFSYLLVPIISLISKLYLGFFYKDVSPIKNLKKAKLPIMFIVGGKDTTVPSYMGEKLFDSYTGPKEFYKNPQGVHIRSYNNNPNEYEERIKSFLNKYFKE